jgi:uncharacterized protein with FMN-binding domain
LEMEKTTVRYSLIIPAAFLLIVSCMRAEIQRTRAMTVNDVSIAEIPDGSYTGSYEYGGFTYSLRCMVSQGRLENIRILQNRTTKYAKKAEGIIPKVIERQKVNVDAVTGATATSKALMKAIERALSKGASKSAR